MNLKSLARRATMAVCAVLGSIAWAQEDREPKLVGFTCCNLHYQNDWISDANWGQYPFLPPGLPIRITEYGRYRLTAEIDGKTFRIGQDYGRQEQLAAFARKIVAEQDPKPKIASWPEPVRAAVKTGRIRAGMTRDQVIAAVGYPPAHQTPTLEATFWKYWYSSFGSYQVEWDEKGRVKDVKADATTRAYVFVER